MAADARPAVLPVLSIRGLCKTYGSGPTAVHALHDVDLDVQSGEFLVLLGASGSGKSTLLNILGGLDTPSSGEVRFLDHMLTRATDEELTRYRREHVGFVFQFNNLIPSLTVQENVALVTDIASAPMPVRIERWGGPEVEGVVRRIEPAAFTKVSALGVEEQRVNVLTDILHPPPSWAAVGDGYRVSLRIVTHSEANVVQVPLGAVLAQGAGDAVYALDNNHARLQHVELGGRNASMAWVRSGVQPGQSVLLYPPYALKDGQAVALRQP